MHIIGYISKDYIGVNDLLYRCSHWPTFPQIFIKGEFIGGSDIILNMHQVTS